METQSQPNQSNGAVKKLHSLHQLLPVYALEGDKLVLRDGRIALGFVLEGVAAEEWTAARYQQLNALFAGALKPLPVDTVVQRLDFFYDQPYRPDKKEQAYFRGKADAHFMDRLMLHQRSYLFLSFPGGATRRSSPTTSLFAQLSRRLLQNPLAGIGERMQEAESLAGEL
ncbi:hypothetical protein, partial [Cesiribacter andamanensis]|uniref:hypothetical protein n=1 Tax=Cesiribacter andamanensis TaxID=649507 RepID=UPI00058C895C